jgi:tRNA(Ile)-lysidine synthase
MLPDIIESAWLPEQWVNVHVLVAVSGGPDSMALLRSLLATKKRLGGSGKLLAAHIHHGLHAAADADQAWLAEQLGHLGVPLTIERVDTRSAAARQGDGVEAAARSLRYAALQSIAEKLGARYVATGHTADDQVETVLHRILRGTGIDGLAGIPRQRPLGTATTVVRPLLDATRQDVLAFLAGIGQAYREDPTNVEAPFMRNRIRRDLLPLLRSQYNPHTDEALRRLARQAEELRDVLEAQVASLVQETVTISGHKQEIVIDSVRLRRQPEPLAREVLRRAWRAACWPEQQMNDSAWRRLGRLPYGGSTRFDLPGGIEVEAARRTIRLFRTQA